VIDKTEINFMISNPEYLQDFALTQPSIQQLDQVQDES